MVGKRGSRGLTPQGWYESSTAGKVHYQSSYERKFMEYLDQHQFIWTRCKDRFPYVGADGKSHNYIPDFYLPGPDLYVEVKGMIRVNDPFKFEAFPADRKLVLVDAETLQKLGIECFIPPKRIGEVDTTKWPYRMMAKMPDYAAPGELSEKLRTRLTEHLDIFLN